MERTRTLATRIATGEAALFLLAGLGLTLALVAAHQQQKRTYRELEQALHTAEAIRVRHQRAEASYRLARAALDRCMELKHLPHGEQADLRTHLAKIEKTFLERLLELPGDDSNLREERADGFFQLGQVLSELGSHKEAIGCFVKSLALFQGLAKEDPVQLKYLTAEGKSLNHLGNEYDKAGRQNEAEDAYRRALDIRVELARRQPDNLDHVTSQADTLNNLGRLMQRRGRWEDAGKAYKLGLESKAVALWNAQADKQSPVVEYQQQLALICGNFGIVCHHLRRWTEAEAAQARALEMQEKLVREQTGVLSNTIALAKTRINVGNLTCDHGDPATTLNGFARALTSLEDVLKKDARQTEARQLCCEAYWSRAAALNLLGRHAEARQDLDRALAIADQEKRPWLLLMRAATQVRLGETENGLSVAEEQLRNPKLTADALYAAACVYAAAGPDEHRASRAVSLLNQARAAGYFKDPIHNEQMKKDHFLDGLRQREDFRKLSQALES